MTTEAEFDNEFGTPGHNKLHLHFGLSYANYLTLPRSVLQSMPDEWQGRFADMLKEVDEACAVNGVEWPTDDYCIDVVIRPFDKPPIDTGITDPLADYQRGRRRLW